jgi:hypothetical protein
MHFSDPTSRSTSRITWLFIILITMSLISFPEVCAGQEIPMLVFNEINCDNPAGPDNSEFLELFGLPGTSLDSLVIVFFEGTDDLSYAAFDLDGYVLDENGFFVLGSALVPQVDLIIPNGIISNGPDAIALYSADATDFPAGSVPLTAFLIDAAVYGTNDPTDAGLMAAFGLEAAGYVQLDETIQLAFPDFSISRIPDGGYPFIHSSFALQEITPGTYNAQPCQSGSLTFEDLSTSVTLCSEGSSIQLEIEESNDAYGDTMAFVLTNPQGIIIDTTHSSYFDFTGFSAGEYNIHSIHYNGEIIDESIAPGNDILDVGAGLCFDLSDNFLTVVIVSCEICNAGTISSAFGPEVSFCSSEVQHLFLTHNSEDANYLYAVTSMNQIIVDIAYEVLDLNSLAEGVYQIYGLSYSGVLDTTTIEVGNSIQLAIADGCVDLSDNYITLNILDCQFNSPCEKVFMSEYLEGEAGTRALELFNPSMSNSDLNEYSLWLYTNGSDVATDTLFLEGTMAPLSAFLITNPGTGLGNGLADPAVVSMGDIVDFIANFTGNDAIELHWQNEVIDVIGVVGENPGNTVGWTTLNGSTSNYDLVRKPFVQSPLTDWQVSSYQWDAYPNTRYSGLGSHFFAPCSEEIIAGFLLESLNTEESSGTLQIEIQCLNANDLTTLEVSISAGNADSEDYSAVLPVSLSFNSSSVIQTILVSINDDQIPESAEFLTLSLSSSVPVFWTYQSMVIHIAQSDPNCDGGTIAFNDTNTAEQCADLANDALLLQVDSEFPVANYLFVFADTNDIIVDTSTINPVNLDQLGAGTFRIFGLSYSGDLISSSVAPGFSIAAITADSCVSLSENFITVLRSNCLVNGCDAGSISTSDGSIFITVCIGDSNNSLNLANSGQSVNDTYTFFLLDEEANIADEIAQDWNPAEVSPGNYQIFGVSYTSTLNPSTAQIGMPLEDLSSDGCVAFSENSIDLQLLNCVGPEACSQLLFSEYIEETGSNKAIEIYNPRPLAINLSDYAVRMYDNGSVTATQILQCSGILLPYNVYVVVSSGNGQDPTDPLILAQSDTLHPVANHSANDAIELVYSGEVIDVIGQVGENPGQLGWIFGNASTSNHALVRRPEVTSPNSDWSVVSGQWIAYEPEDFSHIGWHNANECGLSGLPVISFLQTDMTVNESIGTTTVEIFTSNAGSPFEITVTTGGTATQGIDYSDIFPLALQVPTGEDTLAIEIAITLDDVSEFNESIELEINTSENVFFGNQSSEILIEEFIGIENISRSSLKLWPNPAKDLLHLLCAEPIRFYSLSDQFGKITNMTVAAPSNQIDVDLSGLSAGMYALNVTTSSDHIRQRILVVK